MRLIVANTGSAYLINDWKINYLFEHNYEISLEIEAVNLRYRTDRYWIKIEHIS